MQLIISLLVNALAVFVADYILSGVTIDNLTTTVIVAIVLGVLNTFIKPILLILSLPITIITFGLFALVINALLILLASVIVPGFHVDGFIWALIFAIVLSLISSFLNSLIKSH